MSSTLYLIQARCSSRMMFSQDRLDKTFGLVYRLGQ